MTIDVRRDRPDLYRPKPGEFTEVVVPPMRYLAADGHGDPNTAPEYQAALTALYGTGYAIRAALKARTGDAWVVAPLEGLWSSPDPSAFAAGRKNDWDWTMLIPLPDPVAEKDIDQGLAAATRKRLGPVRVLTLDEGRCLQTLHIGSYDDEAPTLARLHRELMPARGLTFNGRHHEIYLGDPRRVAPEKLRTVLRQPVREG